MIKLTKLDTPKILNEKYKEWTDELIKHQKKELLHGKSIKSNIKNRYSHKDIKLQLIKETSGKCAYCESKFLSTAYGDIEHIVPKSINPLLWFKWSNLTLGCPKCNGFKSNYYSVTNPIINPYKDNIEKHMVFKGNMLIPKTKMGIQTIKILKLNRPELLESRINYIKSTLSPFIYLLISEIDDRLKKDLYQDVLNFSNNDQEFSKMSHSIILEVLNSIENN